MSVFIPSQPPTSVPTAGDLATPKARTGNGFVVSTTGKSTPGDNGAAAYIYHASGRSGVVIDGGAFVAGPGLDDYWDVTKKDVLNLSIYTVDKTGATNAATSLLAADAVPGETLRVDEGIYLIASNVTLTRRVQFENGARFKVANGFTLHLSAGYVAEPTQWVFDIDSGGTVTLDQMAGVSVAHFGAVPDVTAPGGVYAGTNQSVRIQAAYDANESIAAASSPYSDPYRPEVLIPPGSYRLDTGVILRNKSNLYGAGATFFYFGSQASDGAIHTIGEFTSTGLEIEHGTFFCPTTSGIPVANFTIPVANEGFAGTRVDACGSSTFFGETNNYVAIGLDLKPNVNSFVAHNSFFNFKSWCAKWAINFHWRWDAVEVGPNGWANENVFHNCNYTQDSVTRWLGTTAGVRMHCSNIRPVLGWDFGGNNNNRFFGHCFQPAPMFSNVTMYVGLTVSLNVNYLHPTNGRVYTCSVGGVIATLPSNTDLGLSPADANGVRFTDTGPGSLETSLVPGLSVVQNRRYFNPTTRQEYICDVAGTVATVPTNTDLAQSPADANGVRFTHRGPYFHSGVYLDKNGGFNLFHGCRWEYGDGPFCVIRNSGTTDINVSRGNEFLLYDYARQNSYQGGKVLIDDYTYTRKNTSAGQKNTARLYGEDFHAKHVIADIHKRFVASSTGICVRGMAWFDWTFNTVREYATGGLANWKLFKNAFYEKSDALLGVVVDLQETKRMGAYRINFGPATIDIPGGAGQQEAGYTSAVPLDEKNNEVTVATNLTNDCVSNGSMVDTIWTIGGEPLYFGAGANTNITRAFLGTGGGYGSVSTHLELFTVPGGWVNHSALTVLTPDEGRFSTSTPTGGFFLELNELIRHRTTEVFTSSGWRVRQTGVLAPAWVTAKRVEEDELRSNAGNVYAAIAAGTTGATVPTGGLPLEFTSDATSNEIVYTAHGLTNGRRVRFAGIDLPAGIIQGTLYYVVGATANRFQISLTAGGAAVDFTDVGSNTMTYTAIVNDGTVDWEWYSVEPELEEVWEGAALAVGQPAITGNLVVNSDGSSGSWYKANTYISQKTLSGDFDITLRFGDEDAGAGGQSHIIGVTTNTAATAFNNYAEFDYGVMYYTGTEAQVYRRANIDVYNVTWGNRLIRLVRTGTTFNMYINDSLVAMESAVFTANAGTNVLTSVAHGLDDGRPIRFEGVDLADGLLAGTVYYVRDATADTFKVAATIGGAAIDLLDVGSGTQTFFTNTISSSDMHVMYSAYDTTDSKATIYNDDYKPTAQGAAIVATLTSIQPTSGSEVVTSSATPVFRWTIFPGRTKSMTLTANVTAMTFMVIDPGEYTIVFTQDAIGGRTVVWPAGIVGTEPTLNLLGGETTIFSLFYTGTKWLWGNVTTDERVNVAIASDGGGVDWDITNTYISNDTLTGDFDVTFAAVDRQQTYIVGVTASTLPASLANYNTLTFGAFWVNDTTVQVWKSGVSANHAIATWGNGLVRMVRTGSNIDLYVNGALVAAASTPAFGTATQRRMYTAAASVLSNATIYNDESVPIASGSNLTRVNTALPDVNGTETVSFSATASFNFAVDPRKNKKMTLTANATGLIVIAPTAGTYYIALTQDATGGRTVAWATTINGTAPTMAAGANASTLFQIYSNGTALYWA